MTRPAPQDRRRRGAVEPDPTGTTARRDRDELVRLLRFYLPPADQRRLRRTWKRGKR